MNLWDQQSGENSLWYGRFLRYRDMGPTRSHMIAYRADRRDWYEARGTDPAKASKIETVSGKWREVAREFKWETRALAWDEHQRREKLKSIQAESLEVADERRQSILLMHEILQSQVSDLSKQDHPDVKVLRELAQAMAVIFKESRLEYGEPTEIDHLHIDSVDVDNDNAGAGQINYLLDRARNRRNEQNQNDSGD